MAKKEIGMAVSGGGFRATLFHLGAFWRMNEMGYLKQVDRICSVSGGSITTAMLGLKWKKLAFDQQGVATNFKEQVAQPLQRFFSHSIDVPAILGGWLSILKSPGDLITEHYDRLFKGATLHDLPSDQEGPRFIIYATNLQTGVSFRFSRPYMGDYVIGLSDDPKVSLAQAVAASSAFPPVLTPIMLNGRSLRWRAAEDEHLMHLADYRNKIYHYKFDDAMVKDNPTTAAMQTIRTRLDPFSPKEKGHLINWGYALADAGLRKHVIQNNTSECKWPMPDFAL